MSADELLAEIAAKSAEVPAAPLKEVLVALMGDAAATWKQLAMFGTVHSLGFHYPHRVFSLSWRDSPSTRYFDKLVAAIEAGKLDADFRSLIIDFGYKPRDLPSATMVRRLRVVTGEIPLFLPDPTRGVIGHDGGWYGRAKLWQLLWLDAFGMTAPKISLKTPHDKIGGVLERLARRRGLGRRDRRMARPREAAASKLDLAH